jgi:RNA polymerase sigma-70 factor (ECF subfamily)
LRKHVSYAREAGRRNIVQAADGALSPVAAARRAGAPSMSADPPLPQPDLLAAIPRLRRYARVLTGDASRADDLVQETLARGWEKRRLWAAGTDLRAWLFTIMHNVFVNQRAVNMRDAQNVSLDGDADAGGAWQVPVRAPQQAHVELIEVLAALSRLPPEQREVLMLAAVEEMRYEEIATVLSIPVGTVMSRLSRAREKLRRSVAESPSEPVTSLKIVR